MPVSPSLLLSLDSYSLTAGDKELLAQEEVLGLVPVSDSGLNGVAQLVTLEDITKGTAQQTIERLRSAASGQRISKVRKKRAHLMVGLAAPQIGVSQRIIIVDIRVQADRRTPGPLVCYINPEIVWRSRETEEDMEGCFSASPVRGLVRRPVAIKVRALSLDGKQITKIFEGFTARIVQHEVDHLDGIRFPDHIRHERRRHWVHAEELPAYRREFRRWPRLCSQARWEAFKRGNVL